MASATALPILTTEVGLAHYLEEIRRFPMLERREENMLAKRWREQGDRDAANKLVTSHLRLVIRIARNYHRYGLPISEAISAGNIGLMQAVARFERKRASGSAPTQHGGSELKSRNTSCVRGRW